MLILIASTRTPKVNGVKNAVAALAPGFGIDLSTVRYDARDVPSGVPDTPSSIDELMLGARNRAASVFPGHADGAILSVGVEGGLFSAGGSVFLQSWTCVFDGVSYYFGSSGALPVPERLAGMVLKEGIELGKAVDQFARQSDIRSRQGTYGILTNDIITREDSFELSTVFALMPYFNATIYRRHTP